MTTYRTDAELDRIAVDIINRSYFKTLDEDTRAKYSHWYLTDTKMGTTQALAFFEMEDVFFYGYKGYTVVLSVGPINKDILKKYSLKEVCL